MIRTDPPAGEQVEQATDDQRCSCRPGPTRSPMPAHRRRQDRGRGARALLEAAPYSFRVTVDEEETNAGRRRASSSAPTRSASTLVDKGGSVTLVVSSGRAGGRRAQRRRLDRAEAAGALGQFDVTSLPGPRRPATATTARSPPQSVAGGQQAPAGSTITLTVGQAAARGHRRRPPRRPRRRRRRRPRRVAPTTAPRPPARRRRRPGRTSGLGISVGTLGAVPAFGTVRVGRARAS